MAGWETLPPSPQAWAEVTPLTAGKGERATDGPGASRDRNLSTTASTVTQNPPLLLKQLLLVLEKRGSQSPARAAPPPLPPRPPALCREAAPTAAGHRLSSASGATPPCSTRTDAGRGSSASGGTACPGSRGCFVPQRSPHPPSPLLGWVI